MRQDDGQSSSSSNSAGAVAVAVVGSVSAAAAAAAAAELRALRFVYQVRYLESFQAHVCPPLCSHRALCSWSGPVVVRLAGWLTVNLSRESCLNGPVT